MSRSDNNGVPVSESDSKTSRSANSGKTGGKKSDPEMIKKRSQARESKIIRRSTSQKRGARFEKDEADRYQNSRELSRSSARLRNDNQNRPYPSNYSAGRPYRREDDDSFYASEIERKNRESRRYREWDDFQERPQPKNFSSRYKEYSQTEGRSDPNRPYENRQQGSDEDYRNDRQRHSRHFYNESHQRRDH